jgi:hypothetical protein
MLYSQLWQSGKDMPDSRGRSSTRGCISRGTCSDNMSMCDRKLISHRKYIIEDILYLMWNAAWTCNDCSWLQYSSETKQSRTIYSSILNTKQVVCIFCLNANNYLKNEFQQWTNICHNNTSLNFGETICHKLIRTFNKAREEIVLYNCNTILIYTVHSITKEPP